MEFISIVNGFVWGIPMLILIGGTGAFLTVGLVFLPWRKLIYSIKLLFDKNESEGAGEVSPFAALMTALSATVGTGNIAGVAAAIAIGGPGAIFYMWIIALIGMATKYSEAVCAIKYREVDSAGEYVGGPMYYLRNGVGSVLGSTTGKALGGIFAVFGAVAAFGIGNGVQINQVALSLNSTFDIPQLVTGVVVAVLIGLVIFGGIKKISQVASKLIPTMIILYVGASLIVLIGNADKIPGAFELIFYHAFNPTAAAGGFAGAGVALAIKMGVARGIFSNEAGLGSAAIAHAAAKTNNPVKQGLIAVTGVFIDTIIVCTMTALVIITSGLWSSGESGSVLTSNAYAASITGGDYIVTVALSVFAFTTILGWSYYGERCWQYLFNKKSVIIYRIGWVLAVLVFANVKSDLIWNLSDTFNGLMALPNLVGLLILSPIVFKITKEHFDNNNNSNVLKD